MYGSVTSFVDVIQQTTYAPLVASRDPKRSNETACAVHVLVTFASGAGSFNISAQI